MIERNNSNTISSSRYVELLTALIYIILFFIFLTAITYILVTQDDLTNSSWWKLVRYSKLGITLFCSIYLISHTLRFKTLDIKTVKIFFCLFYISVIGIVTYFPGLFALFSDVFAWPLVYLVFYLYSKKHNDLRHLGVIVPFFHLLICILLVRTFVIRFLGGYANPGSVYHAVAFLPMVLLLANKKTKLFLSVFTAVLLFLSAKRTGLIALISGFVCYSLTIVAIQTSTTKKVKKILSIIFFGILIFLIAMYYSNIVDNIFQRFSSISYDQGSGRTVIWQMVIDGFRNSGFIRKMFGHGIQTVPVYLRPFNKHLFSHNSYLEYLYDLGIVGLTFLFLLILGMFISVIRLIKQKNKFAPTAVFVFCIILCFSLFSYCFDESNYILMLSCYWGLMRGQCFKNSQTNISNGASDYL